MNDRFHVKKAALVLCAVVAMACESGMNSPVSPSAVTGSGSSLNSDGSNLKATSPLAIAPLFEATNISTTPTLAARAGAGRYEKSSFGQRFQVSADDFATITTEGMGAVDASGVARYTVDPALATGKRYVWRVRAEMNDAAGPWSNVMAFTTAGAGTTPVGSGGGGGSSTGPRTPDPAPGVRLPLPDMRGVLAQFSDASQSCPRGLKYVNNPWQDRVIDAFRQQDTRWGYNGKPTRTAADNGGVPVIAAGDEAAYHYSAGPDQGSTEVHLVDMLGGHCGSPSITWRVFTGEEPGFWTGAGRF
ncbi:MAG TPA: hypothetical protein VM096_02275 [Vicinamibacterales bacterium]|nr:hypothetical protein [Vicinamibacterales bacterium]